MDEDLLRYLEGMEKRLCEHSRQTEERLCKQFDDPTRDTQKSLCEHFDGRMYDMVKSLREHIDQRWRDAETRIIRAFGVCHEVTSVRMRKIEADVSNINSSTTQQLDAMQSKLLDLETRIINLEGPQGSSA